MENELQLVDDQQGRALPAVQQESYGTSPNDMIAYVMKSGGSIAELREFMMLKREFDADEARKAFVADMAEFKKTPPEIVKDKLVGYKNKDGSVTGYMHATIGNVTEAIVAGLAAHGFSHRWTIDQGGANITVTCVLTHKQGHSESTPMTAQKDDSGKKNQIQQIASTITYLQRYTLLAATGVATKDQSDDDGGQPEEQAPEPTRAKPIINAARFATALAKVRAKEYPAANVRKNFELSVDQETALADAEKEAAQ